MAVGFHIQVALLVLRALRGLCSERRLDQTRHGVNNNKNSLVALTKQTKVNLTLYTYSHDVALGVCDIVQSF